MSQFPEDIYTEQEADPDTLANLGPLRRLAGTWESRAGIDINPKADGPQRREYSERIVLEPIDAQSNGPQLFYGLRYHTRILAPGEDATFHDQIGYWLWEPATGLVLQTLTIPRGQVAIAAGHAERGRHGAGAHCRARPDRVRNLLDDFPRIRLPHRLLPHRGPFQPRRQLELRARHRAEGPRARGALSAPRPQYSAKVAEARAESARAGAREVSRRR